MAEISWGDLHVSLQSKSGAGRIAGGWLSAASGEAARYDPEESTGAARRAAPEPGVPGVFDKVRGVAEAGWRDPGKACNGSEEKRLGSGLGQEVRDALGSAGKACGHEGHSQADGATGGGQQDRRRCAGAATLNACPRGIVGGTAD